MRRQQCKHNIRPPPRRIRYAFSTNDFGRYRFGSTAEGLKKAADGSLTILIQKDKAFETSNRLPAPAGNFNRTMPYENQHDTHKLQGDCSSPKCMRHSPAFDMVSATRT